MIVTGNDEAKKQIKKRLGKAIKKARIDAGFSQKELAGKVGTWSAYISQIETGVRSPSFKLLINLATALNVRVSRLMLEAEIQDEENGKSLLLQLAKLLERAERMPDVYKLFGSLGIFAAKISKERLRSGK